MIWKKSLVTNIILTLATILTLLLLVWCRAPKIVDDADEVKISYTLTFPDGEVFDSGVATVIIGQQGTEIPAFQTLLIGAQVDDVLSWIIGPEEGYGYLYDFSLEQNLSEVYLPSTATEYQVGDRIFLPNVGEWRVSYIWSSNGVVKYTIDFNAPETYMDLLYEVEILEIIKR